jgi:hypothetical protein
MQPFFQALRPQLALPRPMRDSLLLGKLQLKCILSTVRGSAVWHRMVFH